MKSTNQLTNIKFSIVVPVYNAERYLERCISSLLAQNLTDEEYEIIAVNDGSQDTSEAILQRMGEEYKNLKWVTTPNQGVSEARNYGIREAQGKYLLFVDSDDYVQPNLLRQLYEMLEEYRLDILVMDYTYWDEDGRAHLFSDAYRDKPCLNHVSDGKNFMLHCLPQVVWNSAYRTDFWRAHDLRFLPIRHEDEEILPRIFYYAERVCFKKINFYSYIRNPDSFMMNYDVKASFHLIRAMQSVEKFRQQVVKETNLDLFFKNLIASRLLSTIVMGAQTGFTQEEMMRIVREMKKSHLAPLPKGKDGIHKFLYHYLPSWYVAYYRHKKKKK